MRSRIRLTTPFGSAWKVAPHFLEAQAVWPFREKSTLNLQYPEGGVNSSLLKSECEAVYEYLNDSGSWVEPLDSRFRLAGQSNDRLDRTKTDRVDFIALIPFMLEQAYVWEPAGLTTDADGNIIFAAVSPGRILRTLFLNAQGRGWGSSLSLDFTDTKDSAGANWSSTINLTVNANQSLFSILSALAEQGVVDWAGSGRTLQVFNPDSALGREKTSIRMPSVAGETSAPMDKSYQDRATILRVVGDEGKKWDRNIAASPWGRLEAIMGAGGVSDEGTANLFSNEAVLKASSARVSRTREFDESSTVMPHRDYRGGDYVSYQTEAGFERMRVLSMSLTMGQRVTGHAILGDRFEDALIAAARKTNSLTIGRVNGGNGQQPGQQNDWRNPSVPLGLIASTSAYLDWRGRPQGQVMLGWSHTGKATDGTVQDLDRFETQYRVVGSGDTWEGFRSAPGASRTLTASPVRHRKASGAAERYDFRIRAVGLNSRVSAWDTLSNVVMEQDTTPPPVPSKPKVTAKLGTFIIAWDGLGSAGEIMHPDFYWTLIEMGTSPTGPWTQIGFFDGKSETVVAGQPYSTRWFRLASVDRSKNQSAWSELGSATTEPLVDEASIKERLDDAQRQIDEAALEISETGAALQNELNQAWVDINASKGKLTNLETVRLPAVDQALANARTELAAADAALTSALNAAKVDIAASKTKLTDLETVRLPAVDAAIVAVGQQISQASSDLTGKINTANADITAAKGRLDTAEGRLNTAFTKIDTTLPNAITAAQAAAAVTAQQKVDAASALADAQIAQIIARGQNLVRNGDFEAGSDGWNTMPGAIFGAGNPRSGSKVLRTIAPADNVWPTSEWVPGSTGRTYYMEYWIRKGAGNTATTTVGFTLQAKTAAGGTATVTVGTVSASTLVGGVYTKMSFTFTVSTVDTVSVRFAPWMGATANTYDVDDFFATDVTEAQAAIVAAQAAQARADAAHALAGTAEGNAQLALTSASGKTSVMRSLSGPSGVGKTAGDIWWQFADSNYAVVIGEWTWNGTAWKTQKQGHQTIASLDVGSLVVVGQSKLADVVAQQIAADSGKFIEADIGKLVVTGSASMSAAVINKLYSEVVNSRKIIADQILIGKGGNLLVDPYLLDVTASDYKTQLSGWSRIIVSGGINVLRADVAGSGTVDLSYGWVEVLPGADYLLSWEQGGVAVSNNPSIQATIRYQYADGSSEYITWPGSVARTNASGWVTYEETIKIPAGVVSVRPTLRKNASHDGSVVYIRSAWFGGMTSSSLIVDGGVIAKHITASESLSAKVAQFLELDVTKLTVTGSASMPSAVIEKLYSEVVLSRKLMADMVLVGAGFNMIPWYPQENTAPHEGWNGSTITRTRDSDYGWLLSVTGAIVTSGVFANAMRLNSGQMGSSGLANAFSVTEGETYRIKVGLSAGGSYTNGTPRGRIYAQVFDIAQGVVSQPTSPISIMAYSGEATFAEMLIKIPAGGKDLRIYIQQDQPGLMMIHSPSLTVASDASLIVDGGIIAKHITASEEMSAKIATFLSLDVTKLVVTGSAAMSAAVVNKLYTDVVRSRKIATDLLLVGQGDNRIADPYLLDLDLTTTKLGGSGVGWSRTIVSGGMNVFRGESYPSASSYLQPAAEKIEVEAGKTYKMSWEQGGVAASNTPSIQATIVYYYADGTTSYVTWPSSTIATNASGYVKYTETVKIPANVVAVTPRIRMNSVHSGIVYLRSIWFGNMMDASLIVEGAVAAEHITASQSLSAKVATFLKVSAGMIETNAINANNADIGALTAAIITGTVFNGKTFTGGTFNGGTFQTTATPLRGVKMGSSGIFAYSPSGASIFALNASTGVASFLGRYISGQSSEPSWVIAPWQEESSNNRMGIWAVPPGSSGIGGSETGGMFIEAPNTGTGQKFLRLRGQNGGGVDIVGRLLASDIYSGVLLGPGGVYKIQAANGSYFGGLVDFTGGLTVTTSNTSQMANAHLDANGRVWKSSSASRFKIDQRVSYLPDELLDIEIKDWVDRGQLEQSQRLNALPRPMRETDSKALDAVFLGRVPGVIAEDVEMAGGQLFVTYDANGKIEQVSDAKLALARTAILKRKLDEVIARLEVLEG